MGPRVPPKLIRYFEKWLQENETWTERHRNSGRKKDAERAEIAGQAVKSVFKYVKSGRWAKN